MPEEIQNDFSLPRFNFESQNKKLQGLKKVQENKIELNIPRQSVHFLFSSRYWEGVKPVLFLNKGVKT